jgi:hypothetical protein
MPSSDKKKQADMLYNKLHTRQINMRFTDHDSDIIARLDAQKNKQGYIKALIRADISRANSEKMKEDSTMKYEINATSSALPIDAQKSALVIRTAQNLKGDCNMLYTIKPEYLTMWGEDVTEETIIDAAEIERLSKEWNKPIEELMDQLVPAQNPDDPGVPSGGNPWYAVQTDPTDDWSTGSFDLDEAKSMARNLRKDHPDALIAVIDNALENPFCIDEIRDF